MTVSKHIVCPWVTPKIFDDLSSPNNGVQAFFDHYQKWFKHADLLVVNFCTGNGNQILSYDGTGASDLTFDWARYNCYNGSEVNRRRHNLDWLRRVREGGERSFNPYLAGPSFIVSDQVMTYGKLALIYQSFRDEADQRGLNMKLVEYLDPGPEFCRCVWKAKHPEALYGAIDFPGAIVHEGPLDMLSSLKREAFTYAACPDGIPDAMLTGDFVVGQIDCYTRDFNLDGVFLGNQFALPGFWEPDKAPPATPQRRAGLHSFFHKLRTVMGERLVYWMDTYWPVEVEIEKWAMSENSYALLDAVMVSNFAVIVERTQIEPNIKSRLHLASRYGGRPDTLFSFDFVDPWYWYRTHLDDRRNVLFQHDMYRKYGARCQGVSFFANDTFGHFIFPDALNQTLSVIRDVHGW
ncbi:MAG: hypothetical protein IT445_11155 [Phycisphaeraceae bacterium]|nr:hypothetical protein [Phycisphaeraceae bacterium]